MGVHVEESAGTPVSTPETLPDLVLDDPGLVEFALAGTELAGEFRCADCGYGAVIHRVIPLCPMCGSSVWELRGPLVARFSD